MRVNLTKVVRCMVLVLLLIIFCNVLTFVYGPQSGLQGIHLPPGPLAEIFRGHLRQPETKPFVKLKSKETCKDLEMKTFVEPAVFQTIGVNNDSFVYSAFLEDSSIRIIGLRQVSNVNVHCQIWYADVKEDPLVIGDVHAEFIPEDHGRKYTSTFFLCNIPAKHPNGTPFAVSVVKNACDQPLNILLVRHPGTVTLDFTLCVSPLNYRYSRAYELVEMIEMNKMLGAQKLIFYNHSTGSNVDKVLDFYSLKGEIEVVPWHLPVKTDTWPPTGDPEIHYFGQLSALNDCLYRYKNRSHYLVYTDLDEFIIPRQHRSWNEMMADSEKAQKDLAYAQAQCVFFRKEWLKPPEQYQTAALKYNSVVLKHTLKETYTFPHGSRSKYVINPSRVKTVGVHNVWSFSGGATLLPPSTALLHHYRNWEKPDDPQPKEEDLTAVNKYGDELVRRLDSVWSFLSHVPLDINISSYGPFVS
ncbi:glycosyltransferase family 92 protein F13G3.3 [Biomphalaria glabrata]|nr:glycosyltransferase family 92 protein F13G3.3 [Biomphalaria glabrata]